MWNSSYGICEIVHDTEEQKFNTNEDLNCQIDVWQVLISLCIGYRLRMFPLYVSPNWFS